MVFSTSVVPNYNAKRTFLSLLKSVYKLPSLFMKDSFSASHFQPGVPLAFFCSHRTVLDDAFFPALSRARSSVLSMQILFLLYCA